MPDYSDLGFQPEDNSHDDLGFVPDTPTTVAKAVPTKPPTTGQQLKQAGGAFLGESISNLNPIKLAQGAYQMVRHPLDTLSADSAARDVEMQKAAEGFGSGDYAAGAEHYLGGAIPFLGPMVGKAFDAITTGTPEEAGKSIGDVTSLRTTPAMYSLLGKIAASKPVTKVGSEFLGKTTGAGGEAVRTGASAITPAAKKAYTDALRNKTSELNLVEDLKQSLKKVTADRAAAYRNAVSQLDQNIRLNIIPSLKVISDEFKNYKIGQYKGGASRGGIDFSRSPITDAGDQSLINNATHDVASWTDRSPAGMDTLKQRIYNYAENASPQAAPFFYRIGEQIRGELERGVPGYKAMTSDYASASDLIKQVSNELSAKNENPGTIIRKLTNALNQNHNYRSTLIEALDKASGGDLKSAVAGHALRGVMPRGIQGVLAGNAPLMVGAYLHNPYVAGSAVLMSPRAIGETMAAISALRRSGMKVPIRTVGSLGAKTGIAAPSLPPPPK